MSRRWRNILIGVLAAAVLITCVLLLNRGRGDFREKYAGMDLSSDVSGIGRSNTYEAYLAAHAGEPAVSAPVSVDVSSFEGEGGEVREDGLYTSDSAEITWRVQVPQAGLYNVRINYLTTESRGVDIERELLINGEVPFSGASTLCFSRLWTDAGAVRKDNQGNDIRPSQKEVFQEQTAFCRDDMGYQTEPYAFWFRAGENTLTFRSVNEPVILKAVTLTPPLTYARYEDYLAAQPQIQGSEQQQTLARHRA